MLGEASTTKIAQKKGAQGFTQNKEAAKKGGAVAGIARKQLEKETGEKVVSKENYVDLTENKKIEEKNKDILLKRTKRKEEIKIILKKQKEIDEIFNNGETILESEIVDILIPGLEEELLLLFGAVPSIAVSKVRWGDAVLENDVIESSSACCFC